MKVLIDTNIILDIFNMRQPHLDSSVAALTLCEEKKIGSIIASQTTDIFYLLCRDGKTNREAKKILTGLADNFSIQSIIAADVENVLASEMPDYEDALLAICAKRHKMDYIITRNEKDFKFSPVPALSPEKFLERFFAS